MVTRVLLPVVVVVLVAASVPTQDTKEELEKLQGEWTMVSSERKGKKLDDKIVKLYKLTITGDQWVVTVGGKQASEATFKIDPSKDPKTMDVTLQAGDQQVLALGIYKLQGDTLTQCRTEPGLERPKEFKTTEEARALFVWQRAKK